MDNFQIIWQKSCGNEKKQALSGTQKAVMDTDHIIYRFLGGGEQGINSCILRVEMQPMVKILYIVHTAKLSPGSREISEA